MFNFSLMTPIDSTRSARPSRQLRARRHKPAVTNSFMPFGMRLSRRRSRLATGWLTGSLGGAETIVVGQLTGPGAVKVYSSGSAAAKGDPRSTWRALSTYPIADFTEIASFKPFGGAPA